MNRAVGGAGRFTGLSGEGLSGLAEANAKGGLSLMASPSPFTLNAQLGSINGELAGPERRAGGLLAGANCIQGGVTAGIAYERPSAGAVASSLG